VKEEMLNFPGCVLSYGFFLAFLYNLLSNKIQLGARPAKKLCIHYP